MDEKERLASLKRLKRGDENELEKKLRLEKVVASKQVRRARLENDAATKRLRFRLAMETDEERKARLAKVVIPHSSGWPWRQRKKEEKKKEGFDLD